MSVLAIDMGTSSVRAARFSAEGELEGEVSHEKYRTRTEEPGESTLDPHRLVESTLKALDGLALGKGKPPVAAVGMSCFWHGLVGARRGKPSTALFTWADTRARANAERLREAMDPHRYHARTGCRLHGSFWPAKLARLGVDSADAWLGASELVYRALLGEATMSLSMASATGLWNGSARGWDAETLTALSLDAAQLPEVSDAPHRGIRKELAARFPALASAQFFPAVGDGALANLGSGATGPDEAGLTIGTSGALRVLLPSPVRQVPSALFAYQLDARRSVVGGSLSTGGNLWPWILRTLHEVREEDVLAVEPDSHGLTVLPYLGGQRAPDWDDAASGVIEGLTFGHPPAQIARAFFESMAFDFRRVLADLTAFLGPLKVRGSGGALETSALLGPLLADVLGVAIETTTVAEASLRGAALYALERLGVNPSTSAATGKTYRPHPERTRIYGRALVRQRALSARLRR